MPLKIIIGALILILVGAGGYFGWKMLGAEKEPLRTAQYICDRDKTISASYFEDSVDISLSDGRNLSLEKLEGAGERYGTDDENLVFGIDGEQVYVAEGRSQNRTFENCEVAVPGQEPRATYTSADPSFTIRYPRSYRLDAEYAYDQFGEDKLIDGVKVFVPESMATGTNLSPDSGVSIEWLPRARNCTGDIYLLANVAAREVPEGGKVYSLATSSEGAAGNIYEEMVYALSGSEPCIAVRYFIHSTAIENYPEGGVRAFDRAALIRVFDEVRASLTLAQ